MSLLETVAERSELEEGGEGVRRVLREVFRSGRIGTKELAYSAGLPVPVTAAVRRELEKEDLLGRDRGAILTAKGKKFVKEKLCLVYRQKLTCPSCQGANVQIPNEFTSMLGKLRAYLGRRPKPLPWLDQAHGTPETALKRALFMLEKGDVEGRRVIFLGDDDFTSIAVGLLRAAKEITVVDVDSRLLEAIQLVSKEEDVGITCVEWDLRNPLPRQLCDEYDVVFTDPPYTIAGLTLFISRAITGLKKRKGAVVYLAFAHQTPKRMLIVQKTLSAMGLTIADLMPRFNTYKGAEMFANTTFLARLETTGKTKPLVTGTFAEKLYTGEITQTTRTYQCKCGEKVRVGATEAIRTIEKLKEKGCPGCGKTKGFQLVRKQKTKEALASRLVVRNFEWKDFPAILGFEREIAKNSFPEAPILNKEYHKEKLEKTVAREPSSLKVALLRDEIVGWLWLRTERDRSTDEKFGYVKSIIVKPEHRHQGFGRRLLGEAERYFSKKGIRRIDLIVSAANHDASLFFGELGFERQHSTLRKRLKAEGRESVEAD